MTRKAMQKLMRGAAAGLALAVTMAACDGGTLAPPFVVEGEGAVEGRLFLDENRSGQFDPGAGDTPLAGVQLVVLDRGTDQVLAGPVTTDAQGRFAIDAVPPGTHDLLVITSDANPLPMDAVVCRNPTPVSVYRGEPRTVDIAAQDACLISIADARALGAGEFVNIRGIITSFPGQVQSSYVYVQDATAGIQFFTSALNGLGLEIGDLIDVSGVLEEFNNTLQLGSVQLNEVVETGVGAPAPAPVTTALIAAEATAMNDVLQGRLVRVSAAELATGFDTGGSRNATINDGSGPALVRVASGVSTENGAAILSNLGLTVGNCYDITGLVGAFASDGQLFPRSADDFQEVPCA